MWDNISEKADKKLWKSPREILESGYCITTKEFETAKGQLKAAITTECQNLNPVMIRDAFRGMVDRVQKCLNVNGLTFPNE